MIRTYEKTIFEDGSTRTIIYTERGPIIKTDIMPISNLENFNDLYAEEKKSFIIEIKHNL